MTPDEELVLLFGALHLIAAAFGCLLLYLFMRSDETRQDPPPTDEDDSGGGGNDRATDKPKRTPPRGGIPLPDARPARTRFRGAGRLADAYTRRGRRATPEPQRAPARRTPTRR